MNVRRALLPLSALLLLAACHGPMATYPEVADPDTRVVIRFLDRYQAHDLRGMMACLDDEAEFRDATTGALDKAQIERYLQNALEKRPDLQVTFGPPRRSGGTIQAKVRIQSQVISNSTWIFVVKHRKIQSYSIGPGTP